MDVTVEVENSRVIIPASKFLLNTSFKVAESISLHDTQRLAPSRARLSTDNLDSEGKRTIRNQRSPPLSSLFADTSPRPDGAVPHLQPHNSPLDIWEGASAHETGINAHVMARKCVQEGAGDETREEASLWLKGIPRARDSAGAEAGGVEINGGVYQPNSSRKFETLDSLLKRSAAALSRVDEALESSARIAELDNVATDYRNALDSVLPAEADQPERQADQPERQLSTFVLSVPPQTLNISSTLLKTSRLSIILSFDSISSLLNVCGALCALGMPAISPSIVAVTLRVRPPHSLFYCAATELSARRLTRPEAMHTSSYLFQNEIVLSVRAPTSHNDVELLVASLLGEGNLFRTSACFVEVLGWVASEGRDPCGLRTLVSRAPLLLGTAAIPLELVSNAIRGVALRETGGSAAFCQSASLSLPITHPLDPAGSNCGCINLQVYCATSSVQASDLLIQLNSVRKIQRSWVRWSAQLKSRRVQEEARALEAIAAAGRAVSPGQGAVRKGAKAGARSGRSPAPTSAAVSAVGANFQGPAPKAPVPLSHTTQSSLPQATGCQALMMPASNIEANGCQALVKPAPNIEASAATPLALYLPHSPHSTPWDAVVYHEAIIPSNIERNDREAIAAPSDNHVPPQDLSAAPDALPSCTYRQPSSDEQPKCTQERDITNGLLDCAYSATAFEEPCLQPLSENVLVTEGVAAIDSRDSNLPLHSVIDDPQLRLSFLNLDGQSFRLRIDRLPDFGRVVSDTGEGRGRGESESSYVALVEGGIANSAFPLDGNPNSKQIEPVHDASLSEKICGDQVVLIADIEAAIPLPSQESDTGETGGREHSAPAPTHLTVSVEGRYNNEDSMRDNPTSFRPDSADIVELSVDWASLESLSLTEGARSVDFEPCSYVVDAIGGGDAQWVQGAAMSSHFCLDQGAILSHQVYAESFAVQTKEDLYKFLAPAALSDTSFYSLEFDSCSDDGCSRVVYGSIEGHGDGRRTQLSCDRSFSSSPTFVSRSLLDCSSKVVAADGGKTVEDGEEEDAEEIELAEIVGFLAHQGAVLSREEQTLRPRKASYQVEADDARDLDGVFVSEACAVYRSGKPSNEVRAGVSLAAEHDASAWHQCVVVETMHDCVAQSQSEHKWGIPGHVTIEAEVLAHLAEVDGGHKWVQSSVVAEVSDERTYDESAGARMAPQSPARAAPIDALLGEGFEAEVEAAVALARDGGTSELGEVGAGSKQTESVLADFAHPLFPAPLAHKELYLGTALAVVDEWVGLVEAGDRIVLALSGQRGPEGQMGCGDARVAREQGSKDVESSVQATAVQALREGRVRIDEQTEDAQEQSEARAETGSESAGKGAGGVRAGKERVCLLGPEALKQALPAATLSETADLAAAAAPKVAPASRRKFEVGPHDVRRLAALLRGAHEKTSY